MARTVTHRGREYVVSDAHPAADGFRWMSADELDALAADIRAKNGLEYRIRRLTDGRVFDGRNRELACRIAGVEPEYAECDLTDAEVAQFVKSANLLRRHDEVGVRAACAAELAKLTGEPVVRVAEQFGVSERSARYATQVQKADPALFAQVKAGELPVRVAAEALSLPPETREEIATAESPAEAAKAALEERASEEPGPAPEAEGGGDPAPVQGRSSFEEWRPTLPTREELERQRGLKPGNNTDPDHPYSRSLKAMTALVKALNEDMAADETGFLKDNLSLFAKVNAPLRMVLHRSGQFKDGKLTEPCAKFVGLAHLRAVVRDSGKRLKKMTPKQIERLIANITEAPETTLLDREDTE